MNLLFNKKSKKITTTYFNVIETETVEVLLAIFEVLLVSHKKTFFTCNPSIFFEILLPKTTPTAAKIMYRPPI